MNYSKVTICLYPILGEDVLNIVLRYITIHDNTNCQLKYDVSPDRINVHNFCDKYLNIYEKQIFVTNSIFDELWRIYNELGDCGEAVIEQRLCTEHYGGRCIILEQFNAKKLISMEAPKWMLDLKEMSEIHNNWITHYRLDEMLYNAFLDDIYPKSKRETYDQMTSTYIPRRFKSVQTSTNIRQVVISTTNSFSTDDTNKHHC